MPTTRNLHVIVSAILLGAAFFGTANRADAGNLQAKLVVGGITIDTFTNGSSGNLIIPTKSYDDGLTIQGFLQHDDTKHALKVTFNTLNYNPSDPDAGPLTVDLYLTGTDFSFPTNGQRTASSTVASTGFAPNLNRVSSFTVNDFEDGSGTAYGEGLKVGTLSNPSGNAKSDPFPGTTASFSLTRHFTFTLAPSDGSHTFNGQVSVDSTPSPVPVPAGGVLVLTAIPCVGLLGRGRRRPVVPAIPLKT